MSFSASEIVNVKQWPCVILYLISPKILQLARGGFPFAWLVDVKVPAQWSQFHVPLASCKPRLDLEFRWEAFPPHAGRSRRSLFFLLSGSAGAESKGRTRRSDISMQLVVKKVENAGDWWRLTRVFAHLTLNANFVISTGSWSGDACLQLSTY